MRKEKEENKNSSWLSTCLTILVVCIIYIIGMYLTNTIFKKPENVGNSSGVVSAFFSALAFAGIFITIRLQRKELNVQKEELRLTREELAAQKEEFATQNETLKQQRFENTFFQLVDNHLKIVNSMKLKVHNDTYEGRDCFTQFYDRFKGKVGSAINSTELENVKIRYEQFFDTDQSNLGHYFRHMYHILKFINNSSDIPQNNKYIYSNILRSLLSSYELFLLFYNGLNENGEEYFKPLIEQYSLLKNIDHSLLLNHKHKTEYDDIAFASSKERMQIILTRTN